MRYWIVKADPEVYPYADLEREGKTVWDGVRNPQALKNIEAMRPGDRLFFYHSGKERAIVGTAGATGRPYPDPKAGNAKLLVVDIVPEGRLSRPVSLSELRDDPVFAGSPLVRQGRLSVIPVTADQWNRILTIAGSPRHSAA